MSLSPQFLDELRARTSLSALIGRTVALKKAGREWKACCPFHGEKTPSFWVNDDKAFYHCFGCGAHGDAIRFLTDNNGLQFMDAVKELAAAAGMEIPASDPRQAERDRQFTEMREIMARAARWFRTILADEQHGERGRAYADSRLPSWAIPDFEIGYAPRGRGVPRLSQHLVDIPVDRLLALGLVKRKDDGEIYDAFRGRLMFPIHDTRGNVIAFGGRIIGQGEPKYLNSPDTPLFDKGRTLFNAHRAAPAARKAGRLVIVEGYMDVVAFARADVLEVVAPNGTALTEHQVEQAWRMAETPICCFDGDKPGRAAAARAAIRVLPILEPGKSLAFAFPPPGLDPDDVLRERGADAVRDLISRPRSLVDLLWEHEIETEPHETPEQVAGLKGRLRAHVRSIRSPDVREAYGVDIGKRFYAAFNSERPAPAGGPQIRSRPIERTTPTRRLPPPASREVRDLARDGVVAALERAILIGVIRFPDLATRAAGCSFRNADIGDALATLAEYAAMNEVCDEQAMLAEIQAIDGMAHRIEKLTRGQPLPFTFTRGTIVDRSAAYRDLSASIEAMRSSAGARGRAPSAQR